MRQLSEVLPLPVKLHSDRLTLDNPIDRITKKLWIIDVAIEVILSKPQLSSNRRSQRVDHLPHHRPSWCIMSITLYFFGRVRWIFQRAAVQRAAAPDNRRHCSTPARWDPRCDPSFASTGRLARPPTGARVPLYCSDIGGGAVETNALCSPELAPSAEHCGFSCIYSSRNSRARFPRTRACRASKPRHHPPV